MHTTDIIAAAHRILCDAIDIPDDVPEAERDAYEQSVLFARIDAWAGAAHNKLEALHAVRRAALGRADQYAESAHRLSRLSDRERKTAERVDSLAWDLLKAERPLAGLTDADPYQVHTPSGLGPKIMLNPPSVIVEVPTEALPIDLVSVIPETRSPNKVAIKAVLARGEAVPGCRLERSQRFDWGEPRAKKKT